MGDKRIIMVDALRGFALLGLLLVHCVERFELYWLAPAPDRWFDAVFAIFSSKSFAIFALLFGFGFATIMGNERARGGDFTLRFAWRLLLLFAIGTLHSLIYRGDILQVLALIGLLLIPTDRIKSDRVLLVLAFILFAQIPLMLRAWAATEGIGWAQQTPLFWSDTGLATVATGSFWDVLAVNSGPGFVSKWSFYIESGRAVEIAALFLVGMILQRQRLFANAAARRGTWAAIAAAGGFLWLLSSFVETRVLPMEGHVMMIDSIAAIFVRYRAIGATFFQIALFVLAWHSPLGKLLATLAPAGRMTLTLYVGQSLVFAPIFYGYGLGLFDDLSNHATVLIGLVAFALQMVLAAWWFQHLRYGPLEWLWRAGTRGTLSIPLRT